MVRSTSRTFYSLYLRSFKIGTPLVLSGLLAAATASPCQTSGPSAASMFGTGYSTADFGHSTEDPGYSTSLAPSPEAVALPEAPLPQHASGRPAGPDASRPVASRTAGVIAAGQQAPPQTARDKVAVGGAELIDPLGFAAMFLSAAYEQGLNSLPNYGTDSGAFGERLGAAALREESQSVFTYMVFAPLLHQDARYYVEGNRYNPVHRTLYAITRPLITKNDKGHNTINATLLLGYAASAALTPAYYPASNRNAHDVAGVYGGSIGGAALGFFVNEFTQDALNFLHLSKR